MVWQESENSRSGAVVLKWVQVTVSHDAVHSLQERDKREREFLEEQIKVSKQYVHVYVHLMSELQICLFVCLFLSTGAYVCNTVEPHYNELPDITNTCKPMYISTLL